MVVFARSWPGWDHSWTCACVLRALWPWVGVTGRDYDDGRRDLHCTVEYVHTVLL